MIRMIDATELKTAFPSGEYVRTECVRATIDHMQTIAAIPVEWLIERANAPERAPLYRRYAQMLYEEWQKEQEAHDVRTQTAHD